MNMNKSLLTLLFATSMLAGCSLAPDFKMPSMALPESYKETANPEEVKGEWKPAVSLEKQDRGQWWKLFGDEQLNALEQQAADANQSLKAASARVEEARAVVRANAVSFLPDLDIGANALRAKSANASTAAFSPSPAQLKPYTLYSVGATASYDVDLFARARDSERAFNFEAEAQDALYRSALLSLQADVATQYIRLRSLDAERKLLKDTVGVRTEAERIMQKRFNAGSASDIDLSRTQTDLASAKADLLLLDRQRAALENALAILLGQNPSDYHFAETGEPLAAPPLVPAGIPSALLQRRPDIAAAQASMAAANKRIGVARTAFFPSLVLTATGGFESTNLSDIFKWSSRSWALGQQAGSALAMNLFNSGRNFAGVDVADAAYNESVANYRQQVLVALGDVENALTDQRLLSEQSEQANKAGDASARATELLQKRYDNGDVTYFEVVDAQRTSLAAGRAAIQTQGARLLATVALVRALGGDWPNSSEEASNQVTVE